MIILLRLAVATLLLTGTARATGVAQAPDERPRSAEALARFPQPVLVGALAGREVLEDSLEQRLFGRVAGVTRDAAGRISILVNQGGWFGFGTRKVAVPVEQMALLGPFMVALEFTPAQFAALPDAPTSGTTLPPETTIRVGLTKN